MCIEDRSWVQRWNVNARIIKCNENVRYGPFNPKRCSQCSTEVNRGSAHTDLGHMRWQLIGSHRETTLLKVLIPDQHQQSNHIIAAFMMCEERLSEQFGHKSKSTSVLGENILNYRTITRPLAVKTRSCKDSPQSCKDSPQNCKDLI